MLAMEPSFVYNEKLLGAVLMLYLYICNVVVCDEFGNQGVKRAADDVDLLEV